METTILKHTEELIMSGYCPKYLAVDEFAIHKGHTYATCVMDLESGEVLWVGRGRGKEDFRAFFQEVQPSFLADVQAIAMDMNASYNYWSKSIYQMQKLSTTVTICRHNMVKMFLVLYV